MARKTQNSSESLILHLKVSLLVQASTMFSDLSSVWDAAKAQIASISSGTFNEDTASDEVALLEELHAYKALLEEAQMQHVELSKQMSLLLAERDAEISALRDTRVSSAGSGVDEDAGAGTAWATPNSHKKSPTRDEVILNARVEVEKSRAEKAALSETLAKVEAELRLSLQSKNEAQIVRKNMAVLQDKFNDLVAEHKASVQSSRAELRQKTETIDSLVTEYSTLASEVCGVNCARDVYCKMIYMMCSSCHHELTLLPCRRSCARSQTRHACPRF